MPISKDLKQLHKSGELFPDNHGVSLEIALFTTDKFDWDKGMVETEDYEVFARNLSHILMSDFQDNSSNKQKFIEFQKVIGIEAQGIIDHLDEFEKEITVKETGTKIEKKSGTFTDENSVTHKFTLWRDQFKGLFINTKIKISNGYLSFDSSMDDTINIISKNDIKIISG